MLFSSDSTILILTELIESFVNSLLFLHHICSVRTSMVCCNCSTNWT